MKCKNCNGLGRTKATEFIGVDEGLRDVVILCPACGGKGEVESLTEQEYIQTCTTEQLAELLADISLWISPFMKQKNRFELLKKQFCEWLKQPHTVKE